MQPPAICTVACFLGGDPGILFALFDYQHGVDNRPRTCFCASYHQGAALFPSQGYSIVPQALRAKSGSSESQSAHMLQVQHCFVAWIGLCHTGKYRLNVWL